MGYAQRSSRRRCRRHVSLQHPGIGPADARLHTPRLRDEHDAVSGVLPVARRRRQRSLVDLRGARQRHSRQPDRSQEGQADDCRDAGRPHTSGARRNRRTRRYRGVRQGFPDRCRTPRREALPGAHRACKHRDSRPVHGWQPHLAHCRPATEQVRLHRRVQLRPARGVPGADRGRAWHRPANRHADACGSRGDARSGGAR